VSTDDDFIKLVLSDAKEGQIVEQIDFVQLMFQQVRICQITAMSGNREVFADTVMMLLSMIPRVDWDDAFKDELKSCQENYTVGTGEYLSDLTHDKEREIAKTVTEYDYMQLLHAIINLLRRKGTLWREKQVEVI